MLASEWAAHAMRASPPAKQSQVWNWQLPGVGSKSQVGSLSTQVCLPAGVPSPLSLGLCMSMEVSSRQSLRLDPPPGMRSAGTTSVQAVVHLLPGVPLAAPSSHSSPHSAMPSPHRSRRHVGAQPSQATWLPSSHCSPSSTLPLPQTAVFGVHLSVTWFDVIRAPRPSWAPRLKVLDPATPAGCGTTMWNAPVQSLRCVIGVPWASTVVPAFTVSPSGSIALTSARAFAWSIAALAVSGFGLMIEIHATWTGLQLGSRVSSSSAQNVTSNVQLPSACPSSAQPGSPSMQDCVLSGKPPLTWPFESLIRHSAMHELRVCPPEKSTKPPGSGTTSHCASHPLPGWPLSGPASHSSAHSTLPLPQASTWQLALQPSHETVLPSSHCSPGSRWPSPQAAVGAGHGGSVGSTVEITSGVTDPLIVGGIPGSRYAIAFVDGGVVSRLPRMVAFPPTLISFPNPTAPNPPCVTIWLDLLTVTLQPTSVIRPPWLTVPPF